MELFSYRVFGLNIRSDFEIPELMFSSGMAVDETKDVSIQMGTVSESLTDRHIHTAIFDAAGDQLLIRADGVGRMLVDKGCSITIEPIPSVDLPSLRTFLIGWGITAILHQRGYLPLHASAVKGPRGVVLFCAHSGSGKSTTATALSQRGWELVSDDKTALALVDSKIHVYPSFPQVRLWQDAAEHLQIATRTGQALTGEAGKYSFAIHQGFSDQVLPLQAIYLLIPRDVPDIRFVHLSGMQKFQALRTHTYAGYFMRGLGLQPEHFKLASAVAAQAPVTRVLRPKDGYRLNELIDLLEQDFTRE